MPLAYFGGLIKLRYGTLENAIGDVGGRSTNVKLITVNYYSYKGKVSAEKLEEKKDMNKKDNYKHLLLARTPFAHCKNNT